MGSIGQRVFEYALTSGPTQLAAVRVVWHAPGGPMELDAEVRVVLFEQALSAQALPPHRTAPCIGFLLLGVCPPDHASIEDVLHLNEGLRYLRPIHPGHAAGLGSGAVHPTAVHACDPNAAYVLPPLPAGALPATAQPAAEISLWRHLLAYQLECPDAAGQWVRLVADESIYPDDRAFVATHLDCADRLWDLEPTGPLWRLWHQVLHVESSERPFGRESPGALTPTELAWVERRSYRRWAVGYLRGRLWGYSNYSFASLFAPGAWDVPAAHFRGIYLDMLLLVLYQRVSVFSFSRELAALTEEWERNSRRGADDHDMSSLSELRESFGQFVNLYWFPVFTNQVQGLEMYEIARRELDNMDLFEELRQEMDETWGFLDASRQARVEAVERRFSRGATVFAFVGLLLALMGVSNVMAPGEGAHAFELRPLDADWWTLAVAFLVGTWLVWVVALRSQDRHARARELDAMRGLARRVRATGRRSLPPTPRRPT
ncbi:MAG: hypothetical protein IT460_13515 [Planctomycetes bacterium]|nr:hypothetical protein [Planctomycetota bacterium]